MGVTTAGEGGSSGWGSGGGEDGVLVDVGVVVGWPRGCRLCRPG